MREIVTQIANEMSDVLNRIDANELSDLKNKIIEAKHIFIAGTGRSGLIGKVFGMRLMHSGYNVHIVGETTTPSIKENDLLLLISGSGNTDSLVLFSNKAQEAKATIALLTTNSASKIAQNSQCTVIIPAATKKRLPTEPATIQPLGSQFDQAAHLALDALCIPLAEVHKDSEKMIDKHANLE